MVANPVLVLLVSVACRDNAGCCAGGEGAGAGGSTCLDRLASLAGSGGRASENGDRGGEGIMQHISFVYTTLLGSFSPSLLC